MTNDHLISLPISKLDGWGSECHTILHSIGPLAGEVRIEVSREEVSYSPINLRVFDDACACVVPVPELIEAIGTAADRIAELSRKEAETVDFYFSDANSALLFKLTWGGAA